MLIEAEVGLVGQADAGLGEVREVAGGVLGVGVDVDRDRATDPHRCRPPMTRARLS